MSKEKSDIRSDEEIILGIQQGNNLAVQQLYKLYYPTVAKMIINNNGNAEEAQDIFQEAVMVLYDKIKKGNFELSSKLKTFLYAVSKRLWLKQLTRGASRFRNDSITDLEDTLVAEEAIEEHEVLESNLALMEEALNGLGEPCKSIIHEFYILNKSMTEISEKFGYTNSDNAKTQKYKCLQRLKRLFFQIST